MNTIDIAKKIFDALTVNSIDVLMYNSTGDEVIDPAQARRFYLPNPLLMVTYDDNEDTVALNIGTDDMPVYDSYKTRIKNIAHHNMLNFSIGQFKQSIQKRSIADAKIKKEQEKSVMENTGLYQVGQKVLAYAAKEWWRAVITTASATGNYGVRLEINERTIDMIRGSHELKTLNEDIIQEGFGKMFGSAKTSRQAFESVKILVKHSKPIQEETPGVRSRNISAIFLESNGERLRFPHNHLGGARAMARHMVAGGTFTDNVGSYIIESTHNLLKLSEFSRYVTRSNLVNESTEDVYSTIRESVLGIKAALKKLSGVKTYEAFKAKIEENTVTELAESEVATLKDMFTVKKFDEKFEDVLGIVERVLQEKKSYLTRIEEAASNVIYVSKLKPTSAILEFSSKNAKLAYKISELANSIRENYELVEYMSRMSNKLLKEQELNGFEKTVLENVLQNITVAKNDEVAKVSSAEDTLLESKFMKYDFIYI